MVLVILILIVIVIQVIVIIIVRVIIVIVIVMITHKALSPSHFALSWQKVKYYQPANDSTETRDGFCSSWTQRNVETVLLKATFIPWIVALRPNKLYYLSSRWVAALKFGVVVRRAGWVLYSGLPSFVNKLYVVRLLFPLFKVYARHFFFPIIHRVSDQLFSLVICFQTKKNVKHDTFSNCSKPRNTKKITCFKR